MFVSTPLTYNYCTAPELRVGGGRQAGVLGRSRGKGGTAVGDRDHGGEKGSSAILGISLKCFLHFTFYFSRYYLTKISITGKIQNVNREIYELLYLIKVFSF